MKLVLDNRPVKNLLTLQSGFIRFDSVSLSEAVFDWYGRFLEKKKEKKLEVLFDFLQKHTKYAAHL